MSHHFLNTTKVVEVWHDGKFLAEIFGSGDGPGINIITKHRSVITQVAIASWCEMTSPAVARAEHENEEIRYLIIRSAPCRTANRFRLSSLAQDRLAVYLELISVPLAPDLCQPAVEMK